MWSSGKSCAQSSQAPSCKLVQKRIICGQVYGGSRVFVEQGFNGYVSHGPCVRFVCSRPSCFCISCHEWLFVCISVMFGRCTKCWGSCRVGVCGMMLLENLVYGGSPVFRVFRSRHIVRRFFLEKRKAATIWAPRDAVVCSFFACPRWGKIFPAMLRLCIVGDD